MPPFDLEPTEVVYESFEEQKKRLGLTRVDVPGNWGAKDIEEYASYLEYRGFRNFVLVPVVYSDAHTSVYTVR